MWLITYCSAGKPWVFCKKLLARTWWRFVPGEFLHPGKVAEKGLLHGGMLSCRNVAFWNVKRW